MYNYKKSNDAHQNSVGEPITKWPSKERPRERLLQIGPEGLSDGELLAVLLRIGKAGQSAEELGRLLLNQFNGISGIDRAHMEDLLSVPGMGIAKVAQLKAAIEISKRARRQAAEPTSFNNAADVAYVRPRFERNRQRPCLSQGSGRPISVPYGLSHGAEPGQMIRHQRRLNEKHAKDIKNYLFELRNRNDKVPFDLRTFKYVPISQAAEIPNKVKAEIVAILRDTGAPL